MLFIGLNSSFQCELNDCKRNPIYIEESHCHAEFNVNVISYKISTDNNILRPVHILHPL